MTQAGSARIEDRLRHFIQQSLDQPVDIADTDRLIDRGYIPSLQLIALAGFLEDTFGIVLDPFGVTPETFESIATIAAYVRAQGGA